MIIKRILEWFQKVIFICIAFIDMIEEKMGGGNGEQKKAIFIEQVSQALRELAAAGQIPSWVAEMSIKMLPYLCDWLVDWLNRNGIFTHLYKKEEPTPESVESF